nr:MAG TPA: regulatory protein [Caudoviricetes sp.]
MDNIKLQEIENAIKENGYTKIQFAEILGIKRDALHKKLRGQRAFTKLEKEKIEELLNVEVE